MRFIHVSDLHLGRKPYGNETLYLSIIDTFRKVVDFANKNKIGTILIAGDLFDSQYPDWRTLTYTQDIIYNYNGYMYAIHGNHDKSSKNGSAIKYLSKSTDQFNVIDDGFSFSIEDPLSDLVIEIYGLNWAGSRTAQKIKDFRQSIDPYKFNVFLGHFGLETKFDGIEYQPLKSFFSKFDYVGLGHIHKPYLIDNNIVNPGSPFSLSFTESEFLGRSIVDVTVLSDKRYRTKFHKIDDSERYFVKGTFDSLINDNLENKIVKVFGDLTQSQKNDILSKNPLVCLFESSDKQLSAGLETKNLEDFGELEVLKSLLPENLAYLALEYMEGLTKNQMTRRLYDTPKQD